MCKHSYKYITQSFKVCIKCKRAWVHKGSWQRGQWKRVPEKRM